MKAYKENIIQDIVGELGNVGIGSAATSLSSLLGRQILTTTSQVNIIDEQTFIQWKDAYEQTIGILFPLEKELNGFALFLMDEKIFVRISLLFIGSMNNQKTMKYWKY